MATETTTIRVVADTSQAERALGKLTDALGALASAAAITQFARFADSITSLTNKLSLVTQEGQSASQAFGIIAKSALQLGAPLKDVGDLFFRVANNTKDLGLRQSEQVKITETLIKGFQLTGATAGEVSGGVIQLGQAFAVGVLRGDELNSVLESLPMVAQALADKFGVQTGALKALGEQGKITSKDLADAILSSGAAIDSAWGNKLPTVTESFNKLGTVVSILTKRFDEQTGISQVLSYALLIVADAVISIYEWFQKWGKVIGFVAEALLYVVAPLKVARTVFLALIGPIESLIALFSAGGGAVRIFGSIIGKLGDYIAPVLEPISVLGSRIAQVFGLIAAGATALGLGKLVTGIKDLFGNDKATMAENYKQKLDDINKRLGIDNVKASEQARAASGGLTAEQVKNEGIIRKANNERNAAFKEILRNQQESLKFSSLEGSELEVQQAVYNINKQLVKDIKNDKGEIIGQTKGITAEEEKTLRVLIEKGIQNKLQRDLNTQSNSLKAESNRLNITDLNLREEQAAVDAKRLEYGRLFTAEMEAQVRASVKMQQANRDSLAVEQARRALAGQQTFAESIQRGTGVQQRLNPQGALDTQYKMDMDALRAHLDAKLITEQEYQDKLLKLKQEYTSRGNELYIQQVETEKTQRQTAIQAEQMRLGKTIEQAKGYAEFMMKTETERTQFAIEQAANMFSSLGQQNKKAFEAAKAFNIANAIMNTYMAATKAMATYPWPFGLVAAAAAVAAGMAQVGAIRSQQYSGRQLGGPVMGNQSYLVGENGPELFTPNTSGSITRNRDLQQGGTTNINFTIVANDTTGFDQLLTSRRGVIQQIISDAMLERGQRM